MKERRRLAAPYCNLESFRGQLYILLLIVYIHFIYNLVGKKFYIQFVDKKKTLSMHRDLYLFFPYIEREGAKSPPALP